MRELSGKAKTAVYYYIVGLGLFHLYTALLGAYEGYLQRTIHLTWVLFLVYILYPMTKNAPKDRIPWYDWIFATIAALPGLYGIFNFTYIVNRFVGLDPVSNIEVTLGVILILALLEASRRTVGLPLAIVAGLFSLYMLWGHHLPGVLKALKFDLSEMVELQYLSTEGIFSVPLGSSATYIVLFLIFGGFLEKSGIGEYFMAIATSLTGSKIGGPAKISVVGSCLFGTITGSAVANVYSTGIFTIPMMKKAGYDPNFAAGTEAVASTGGQILPPIMGAAAFIMASLMGVPYRTVMVAALLPAILYYVAVFMMVHLRAVKLGLKGISADETPPLKTVLKKMYLFIPVVCIFIMLLLGYTPMRSANVAICVTIVVSFFDRAHRMGPKQIIDAIYSGVINLPIIAIACAVAGIIVGAMTLTGFGFKFVSAILSYSRGIPLLGLSLMMLICLILGMGLPTSGAYIITASLGVPALTRLGFSLIASHMFCLYFAILTAITPPVALAAYAAASIAKTSPNLTAIAAVRLGIVAFLIPFAFCFDSSLLLGAPTIWGNLFGVVKGVAVAIAISWAFEGYVRGPIPIWIRVLFVAGSLLSLSPNLYVSLCGLVLIAANYAFSRKLQFDATPSFKS